MDKMQVGLENLLKMPVLLILPWNTSKQNVVGSDMIQRYEDLEAHPNNTTSLDSPATGTDILFSLR
jgi:hypothetical protein